jgi:hypothetical protein
MFNSAFNITSFYLSLLFLSPLIAPVKRRKEVKKRRKLRVIGNNWQKRTPLKTEKLKVLFYPMIQISERTLLFGWFPEFAHLSFW